MAQASGDVAPVRLRVKPLSVQDLEANLTRYEGEFGMPSAAFADAYARGEAGDIPEATALDWFMTFQAWKLVSAL
jgi:hypothetical protein